MTQDGGQVLHAEPGGTFTPVWVVLAVMALSTAIDAVVRSPGDALSIVVAGTTVLIPVGVYVTSKRRYGRLEVTGDTLRIGKERFPLADLDPEPLEREDGTPVTILSGLTGENQIAEDADAVDAAVSLLMVYGVPISAIKAQA